MDEYSIGANIGSYLVGGLIGMLINSVVIWVIVNYMIDVGGKTPFKKCIVCVLALMLVNYAALACLHFIPIPFVNLAVAGLIWYKGSIAAIEGSMEATHGGLTVMILYNLVFAGVILGLISISKSM